jgi:hypothetical protein
MLIGQQPPHEADRNVNLGGGHSLDHGPLR